LLEEDSVERIKSDELKLEVIGGEGNEASIGLALFNIYLELYEVLDSVVLRVHALPCVTSLKREINCLSLTLWCLMFASLMTPLYPKVH